MSKDEIKELLIGSFLDRKKVETTNLNEMADKIEKCEKAAAIVREYEKITCTKKRIICLAYHLGEVF